MFFPRISKSSANWLEECGIVPLIFGWDCEKLKAVSSFFYYDMRIWAFIAKTRNINSTKYFDYEKDLIGATWKPLKAKN